MRCAEAKPGRNVRQEQRRKLAGCWAFCLGALLLLPAPRPGIAQPLSHGPVVWYENDDLPIAPPKERAPNLRWDYVDDSVVQPLRRHSEPARLVRDIGTVFGGDHVPPAANLNSLDEVPNSSWFTNRIGIFPLDAAAAARGPGDGDGPEQGAPWTVISAKTEGVTPGFVIRDAARDAYLIKFDPPGYIGMTTGAGVISNRILHAAGYNVPDDAVVFFRREDLVLGQDVKLKLADGSRRAMTQADLDAILAGVETLPDGSLRAIASKFVDGRPVGPFNYHGRRRDDPNDRIPHQQRRELRGLRIFAAWLNHFDTKQHNTLDAFQGSEEQGHVVHYLIDFASTLGSGASGPSPRYGREYTLDLPAVLGRTLALGLHEGAWWESRRPEGLSELGYFSSADFDPFAFDPLQPNSAFADCTDRDAYWAAKIISAFTDAQLAVICEQARYRDPAATAAMARILAERRDIIARRCFDRVPPLDFFQVVDGVLLFRDLGVERDIYAPATTRYRVRLDNVDDQRRVIDEGRWIERGEAGVSLSQRPRFAEGRAGAAPFVAARWQVDRGEGWSDTVAVYISQRTGHVAALER